MVRRQCPFMHCFELLVSLAGNSTICYTEYWLRHYSNLIVSSHQNDIHIFYFLSGNWFLLTTLNLRWNCEITVDVSNFLVFFFHKFTGKLNIKSNCMLVLQNLWNQLSEKLFVNLVYVDVCRWTRAKRRETNAAAETSGARGEGADLYIYM